MATVWITSLMRDISRGRDQVEVSGETVGEVIGAMDALYPGIRDRLCTAGKLDGAITVLIDGVANPLGLAAKTPAGSEIHFLPIIGGG